MLPKKNYPQTVQLGSVTDIKAHDLPKIDLLIGGSPCQGFSFAGLQLAFDDPRSKLFFEYVRILKELRERNPDVKFILENVKMAKAHQDIITNFLGCNFISINSASVSAQSRTRFYWTNISDTIEQPTTKNIKVKDILQNEVDDRYYLTGKWLAYIIRKGDERFKKKLLGLTFDDKAICHTARAFANWNGNFAIVAKNGKVVTDVGGKTVSDLLKDCRIRRYTPIECERLQTVPDNYTNFVSDAQRYRMLGNGWNVDTIVHILEYLYF